MVDPSKYGMPDDWSFFQSCFEHTISRDRTIGRVICLSVSTTKLRSHANGAVKFLVISASATDDTIRRIEYCVSRKSLPSLHLPRVTIFAGSPSDTMTWMLTT